MSEEEQIILPDGYTKVSYLESSGSQYITTDYYPEAGQKYISMDIQFIPLSDTWSGNKNIFQASEKGNPNGAYDILYGCAMNFDGSDNQRYEHFFWMGGDRSDNNDIYSSKWSSDTVTNRNLLVIQGDTCTYGSESATIINGGTRAGTVPLTIFGAAGKPIECYRMRLYEFKMGTYENGNISISLHLIPCLDDSNKLCMYDVISGKSYYNNGSGTFASDVYFETERFKRVDWIENPITSSTSTNGKIFLPLDFKFYKDGSGDSSLIYETEHSFSGIFNQSEGASSVKSTSGDNNEEFYWLMYSQYIGIHAGAFISFTDIKPKVGEFLKIRFEWTPSLVTFTVVYNGQTYSKSTAPNSTWMCSKFNIFQVARQTGDNHFFSMGGKKKYCKIWKNGELIYHLVPCIDKSDENNVACMYDLVSKQAFYNQGTGKFLTEKDYLNQLNNNYNLPSGFKKCVYLQSDGTQWINTQVIPNSETGLYFKALQLSYGNFVPLGVEQNGYTIYPPRYSNKDLYYKWGNTSTKMMTWDKADDLIFSSSINLYNSKLAIFNSSDSDASSIITQAGTFTIPIWLFTYNANGSYNATYGKWGGRIYRAQITHGDALIHDYVPCLDANGRPCMYDLIEEEALYNQSGGVEFSYCVEHQLPSDFVKLKYLESTGTQFIKTGYIPTNNTGLYIDAYNVKIASSGNIPISLRNTNGNTYFSVGRMSTNSSYPAGFGWGAWTASGGTGDVRYEATLNWLNDKKSIITAPAFAQRVNSLSTLSFTPSIDLCMFGHHSYDNIYSSGCWRIYRAKISEGSEIVRDFVPAYDTLKLKPCMYDLINNVAYYNDGTGEFLHNRDFEGTYKGYTGLGCIGNRLGSDYNPIDEKLPSGYTKIEFLESTGTQYIKTEIDPRHLSYKIVFDGFNGSGSGLQLFGVEKYTTPNYYWYGTITQNNNNGIGFKTIVPAEGEGNFINSAPDNPIGSRGISEVNFNENYVYIKGALEENKKTCGDYTERILATHTSCGLFANQNGVNKCKARVYSLQGNYHGIEAMNFIPVIDPDGKPCMYDSVRKRTFYKAGGDEFIAGLKTLSNALQLRLSNSGGTITLSLPTNDNIEYYEEKIRANNPNWTITFQYH